MTNDNLMDRFEELCAGQALGDLSHEEERELAALSEELGIEPDAAFELLAVSLELEALKGATEPMPAALEARLRKCATDLAADSPTNVLVPVVPAWRKVLGNPIAGWAAAAAVAIFAMIGSPPNASFSPAQAESKLRSEARDLIERNFEGLGDFKSAGGKVIWSDQLQQGFMTLTGIPVNDPGKSQYQLWIVDPKRDEAPVDGGVFDIPTDGSPVVIPISAKLALTQPQAFVITLEQPGGVVKSKQEMVVALAKG
ncbi:MAG: anti-sigma factor domain-containing protein [Luteolibacter sp.]